MGAGAETGRRRAMSQINVTPFVDVMLVLLVIFLVTAPMMESGIDVNLPKVASGPITSAEEPIVISINKKGAVIINKKKVPMSKLNNKLKAVFKRRKDRTVYLKADESVPYGQVAKAMAEIRKSGISKIAMITEPPSENK